MKHFIKRIKNKLYSVIFWQTRIGEFFNKRYDLKLFYKHTFEPGDYSDKENLRASLTKEYHIIEKGLSLPTPRFGFGKLKIPNVIEQATIYESKYGADDYLIPTIKESLADYLDYNKTNGEDMTSPFYKNIEEFVSGVTSNTLGGTKTMLKKEVEESIQIDYKKFIEQRVSVRDFSDEKVTKDEIIQAIDIAKISPSVCNRQSWRTHVYLKPEDIAEILTHQHGNSGFGFKIKVLILITTDLKAFTNLESNQVFTDGGIFSMSLMLALHAGGLGTCAMNTCIPFVDEKKIKVLGNIPSSERLIMMLGVGKLKDEFKVPISLKKRTDEIVTFH